MNSVIILAAGESTRFGSPKQLAKINNKTLIECVINSFRKAQVDEIIVVLGAHREEIQKILPSDVILAVNEQYKSGQTSSIKCGLQKLSKNCDNLLIAPVDLALIKPETIQKIIAEFQKSDKLIGIPTFNAKKGHPPIYKAKVKSQIVKLNDNEPLYLVNHSLIKETLLIEVDDAGILTNINTPDDLKKLNL